MEGPPWRTWLRQEIVGTLVRLSKKRSGAGNWMAAKIVLTWRRATCFLNSCT